LWDTWTTAGVHQYQGPREYRDIGAKLSGTGEIIAVDQEHIKGTIHMTATGSGKKMITDGALTAKWLGSSCANCEIGGGDMNRAAGGHVREAPFLSSMLRLFPSWKTEGKW